MSEAAPPPGRFSLLVFDWDGTLCDSLDGIVVAMSEAARRFGLPPRQRADLLDIIGLGLDQGITALYPDLDETRRKEIASAYRETYLAIAGAHTQLYPDAAHTVRRLHGEGYLMAVATGKSRRGLDRAMQQCGMQQYFHASRCADETFSKPHPQMLEELIEIFGVTPDTTLMIGDSEHDLQMAANAKVPAIAVNYGAQSRTRLLEFNPLSCLDRLADLPAWLARRNAGTGNNEPKA